MLIALTAVLFYAILRQSVPVYLRLFSQEAPQKKNTTSALSKLTA